MKQKLMVLLLVLGACDRPTTGAHIPIYEQPQVALMVVAGREAMHDRDAVIAATNRLIENTRPQGVDLLYVREHAEADPDSAIHIVNDKVFPTQRGDAFSNPDLDKFLRERSVDHLVLAGSLADPSVELTARGALNRGYKVMVVADALAAVSEARRDRAIASLRRAGAEITDSERVVAEWTRRKHYLGSR